MVCTLHYSVLQYYSDVLEGIARAHVQNCMNEPNVGRHTASRKFRVVGETIGLSLSRDITSLIEFWFAQGGSYDYDNRRCNPYGEFDTCDDYLEV